jgi:hypothetical protein
MLSSWGRERVGIVSFIDPGSEVAEAEEKQAVL